MKKMKLRKVLSAALAASMIMTAALPQMVMADGQKVVTLGADLSDEQKNTIRKYFGISNQNIETILVTNQDERDTLGGYVPLEQIGTRAISCAYVQPTSSGGIQVKTANLNYVTANMIAAALSTSGVSNCNVIAAAPFEVSGTGALTGVMKAYEIAAGTVLDSGKKATASQELVTTGKVAGTVGQTQATKIVNDIKVKVVEENITQNNTTEITNIVNNVVNNVVNDNSTTNNYSLTDEEIEALIKLAEMIAEQDYDYEDIKETTDRINENVTPESELTETEEDPGESDTDVVDEDAADDGDSADEPSILADTDVEAFGTDVVVLEDTTDEEEFPVENPLVEEEVEEESDGLFEIMTEDTVTFGGEENTGDDTAQDDTLNTDGLNTDDALNADDTDDGWTTFDGDDFTDGTDDSSEFFTEDDGADEYTEEFTEEFTDDFSEDFTEENTDYVDEAEPEAATVETSFVTDPSISTPSFDPFGVPFYVSGNYIPASGTYTIVDAQDTVVASGSIDSSNTGALPVIAEGDLSGLGWDSANQIYILLGNAMDSLYNGVFHITADIVFARPDDSGYPIDGTETASVHMESTLNFNSASLMSLTDDYMNGFKAGGTATLSFTLPEGASYAVISSGDSWIVSPAEEVIYPEDGVYGAVTLSLNSQGDTDLYVTYMDEAGNTVAAESITAAAF